MIPALALNWLQRGETVYLSVHTSLSGELVETMEELAARYRFVLSDLERENRIIFEPQNSSLTDVNMKAKGWCNQQGYLNQTDKTIWSVDGFSDALDAQFPSVAVVLD